MNYAEFVSGIWVKHGGLNINYWVAFLILASHLLQGIKRMTGRVKTGFIKETRWRQQTKGYNIPGKISFHILLKCNSKIKVTKN